MTWNDISKNWTAFAPALLQRWPNLSENGLSQIDGSRARLISEIADTHELTKAEAEEDLESWMASSIPSDVVMDPHHDNASIKASAKELAAGETPLDDDKAFGDDALADRPMGRAA